MSTLTLTRQSQMVDNDENWFEMRVSPTRPRLTLVRRTESFIHDDPSEYKQVEVVEFDDNNIF